jgi:hypothetical protein
MTGATGSLGDAGLDQLRGRCIAATEIDRSHSNGKLDEHQSTSDGYRIELIGQ